MNWVNFVSSTLVPSLDDFIKNTWQTLKIKLSDFITSTWANLKTAIDAFLTETWPGLKTAIETLATTINEWSKIDFKRMLEDAISSFKKGVKLSGGPAAGAIVDKLLPDKNDFIMRPGGIATTFSPDDTIIGIKDTSKLGGGGNTINANITINGTNLSPNELKSAIMDGLEAAMAMQSRNGHFQRGY